MVIPMTVPLQGATVIPITVPPQGATVIFTTALPEGTTVISITTMIMAMPPLGTKEIYPRATMVPHQEAAPSGPFQLSR